MSASILLSDGDRTLELAGILRNGISTQDFNPPIVARDITWIESVDLEGRRRGRSKAQNPSGSWKGAIGNTSESAFWDDVDNLQEMIESVHSNRGSLRYAPPPNGAAVTFDIESIELSGLPQKGVFLAQLLCEPEFTFECLPYGRLDPVTIFTAQALAGPIASIDLTAIPGHVDALAELILTEASGFSRGHVEIGLQEDYDSSAPEPLYLNRASGITSTGYAGASNTRSGSYAANVTRATLTSSPVVVCATTAQPHKNRWKVRCRVYPTAIGCRVRLGWKIGDGPVTRERWVDVPAANNFFDLDLETISIDELPSGHSWTGFIEAYASAGTPTLDVDTIFLIPA
jgi:hypothetical protein